MTTDSSIGLSTRVARAPGQLTCELDGELVLMAVEHGTYFQMDPIGTRIWALLETPARVDALCDRLADRYDVDRGVCASDTVAFLNDLHAYGLITVATP